MAIPVLDQGYSESNTSYHCWVSNITGLLTLFPKVSLWFFQWSVAPMHTRVAIFLQIWSHYFFKTQYCTEFNTTCGNKVFQAKKWWFGWRIEMKISYYHTSHVLEHSPARLMINRFPNKISIPYLKCYKDIILHRIEIDESCTMSVYVLINF